ncbi:hypothetical protein V6N13_009165 [Hibiscus sabdariffa]
MSDRVAQASSSSGSQHLRDESERDNSFTASAKFKGYELENRFPRSSPIFSPGSTTKAIIIPGIAPNISNTSKDNLSSEEISNFNGKLPVGQSINTGLAGHISGQNHNESVVAFDIKMTIKDKEQDIEQTEALKRPCAMVSPSKVSSPTVSNGHLCFSGRPCSSGQLNPMKILSWNV